MLEASSKDVKIHGLKIMVWLKKAIKRYIFYVQAQQYAEHLFLNIIIKLIIIYFFNKQKKNKKSIFYKQWRANICKQILYWILWVIIETLLPQVFLYQMLLQSAESLFALKNIYIKDLIIKRDHSRKT